MSFPKHHGIELAKNSFIKNLNIESLVEDPTVFEAGSRIWYSEADGVVKFVVRGENGLAIVKSIYDAETAAQAIADLEAAIAVAGDVDGKISAAITALDTSLKALISAEASAREAADLVVASNAADATATEAASRLAGDTALGLRIDGQEDALGVVKTASGLNVDGTFEPLTGSNYLDGATNLAQQAELLDVALKAEVTRATGVEGALSSAIANEAQLREDGIENLQQQLTDYINGVIGDHEIIDQAEAAARIAADQALQAELDRTQATVGTATDGSLIPIEGTNYLDAATTVFGGAFILDVELKRVDDALAGEIAQRQADTAAADSALQAEVLARTNAVTALQTEIDATQVGAGLEADGSFAAPTGSNYLNTSVSLKDAALKLDTQLKAVVDALDTVTGGEGGAIVELQGQINEIRDDLEAEITRADAAETVLDGKITAERNRAEGAELTLTQNLAAAVADIEAVESSVAALDASKVSTTTYNAGIAGLQAAIDALEGGSGKLVIGAPAEIDKEPGMIWLGENGLISYVTAGATEGDLPVTVTVAVDEQITALHSRITGEVSGINARIDTEVQGLHTELNSTRDNLQGQINAIETQADASTDDIVQLKADVVTLQGQVGGLNGEISDAKDRLDALEAGGGTAALITAINDKTVTYESTGTSLTHVVEHNFNSEFVSFHVMVLDPETSKYRNDIVPVEETDTDTLTITLSVARKIKVIVTNHTPVSLAS